MPEVKKLTTLSGHEVHLLAASGKNITHTLSRNRAIPEEILPEFFSPTLAHLHDPFLMPDILPAVDRIIGAHTRQERVVIFGDYDVDGVSSTALLVKFLKHELGIDVSYRLPHRVHDGYGLKDYFFDDLYEKSVKLVITVDCGTRDIQAIQYAKQLGIDVIVTDHHAVPESIPTEVIGILNPKRPDSAYPFPSLAGAGVAFKLVHALILRLYPDTTEADTREALLTKYIDIATLGTIADCMPLV